MNTDKRTSSQKIKRTQRRSGRGAAQRILECGGKRSATPLSSGRDGWNVRCVACVRKRCRRCARPPQSKTRPAPEAKAAPAPPAGGGHLPGVRKKLVAIRGR